MVISEKFIEIFNWYESDLEEIQHIYEKYKVYYKYPSANLISIHLAYYGWLPLTAAMFWIANF